MTEATGLPAGTLHRTLEPAPPAARPGAGRTTLDADLVVVDEVSMLDALLANQLAKAVAPGAHLLLVGDPDQPAERRGGRPAGRARADRFPATRLTHIFRQGAGSGSPSTPRGSTPATCPASAPTSATASSCPPRTRPPRPRSSSTWSPGGPGPLPLRGGRDPGAGADAPGRRGVGVLNTLLQERLNPPRERAAGGARGGRVYRSGDRVLQLKNDYELEVFNGDLGSVAAIDPAEQEVTIALDDGRAVRYPQANLYALTHAYAVSVHKAQGAEFPAVVIPLVTAHAALLGRTLLYTALTRARRLVVLVGQRRAPPSRCGTGGAPRATPRSAGCWPSRPASPGPAPPRPPRPQPGRRPAGGRAGAPRRGSVGRPSLTRRPPVATGYGAVPRAGRPPRRSRAAGRSQHHASPAG